LNNYLKNQNFHVFCSNHELQTFVENCGEIDIKFPKGADLVRPHREPEGAHKKLSQENLNTFDYGQMQLKKTMKNLRHHAKQSQFFSRP